MRTPNPAVYVTCSLVVSLLAPRLQADTVDFNRDIRPILSDKCYACHGPDAGQRQGGGEDGLRLDTQQGAFTDLGGYFALVSGDLEASELVRRITSDDPDEVMPPSDHRKSLTPKEQELIVRWVKEGANWSRHWAYEPLRPVPRMGNHWIDSLVRAKLAQHDLQPSSAAADRVLVRRVFFDLIGLPPTKAEVDQFLADDSNQAWENLIDRLLASPHFGERLAIYWLDLVRYADTVGYHGDQDVSVSPYRDYVINAFNSNMPFDRFTREQLAGDLLHNPTRDQLVASGYNKLGMMSAEGGAQPKEYLAKYASDRVRTASTVWLGSTLGCAECHDHKFDPFTQKDFYQFASFFADIKERGLYAGANSDSNWGPTVRVPDGEYDALVGPINESIAELTSAYQNADIAEPLRQGESSLGSQVDWQILEPAKLAAMHETKLVTQPDHSVIASGPRGGTNTYTIDTDIDLGIVSGLRLEVLPDASLPKQGPGRAGNGNFVLTEWKVFRVDAEGHQTPLKWKQAAASFEQADGNNNPYKGWKAQAAIDGDVKGKTWGWAILPKAGQAQEIVAEFEAPITSDQPIRLVIQLEQNHKNPDHTIGRFRLSATSGLVAVDPRRALPAEVKKSLDVDAADRSPEQLAVLSDYYRKIAPELAQIREGLDAARKEFTQVEKEHTRLTLITKKVEPRVMRVLPRGNWMDDSGEIVQPDVPHFLPPIKANIGDRATRLDLANWITSGNNPLTARVFVNRLWKLYFGAGLSKVLDDIGSQGEFPVHADLLDALAAEFVDSGWNIKHMIKLIVMSKTYRQSSLMRADLAEVDPYNRLLARQSRFRLEAELVRDNALAVSGLLVKDLGGRSVKPYQPPGLLRHLNFPKRTYKHDRGANQYRRGVYTHWQRQFLHPAMKSFDAPAREECTAERPRSNTPLAALVLLNDPSYVEAARTFAEKILQGEIKSDKGRINEIFLQALSRDASSEELDILASLVASQRFRYARSPEIARDVVSAGETAVAADLDVVELASLMSVTRAVFNVHEFITRN